MIAYNSIAAAKIELGDYSGAIKFYSKSIELDETKSNSYIKRGYAKVLANDKTGALQDYNKAIEIDNSPAGYYQRGLLMISIGQDEKGCKDLKTSGDMGLLESYDWINIFCK